MRARVSSLVDDVGKLDRKAIRSTKKLLKDAKKSVLTELQQVGGTEWDQFNRSSLNAATDRAIGRFTDRYASQLRSFEDDSWVIGKEFIDQPLDAFDELPFLPELNITALEILQSGSTDLVTNTLGSRMANKVKTQIGLGLLGQKTPFSIMRDISAGFDGKKTGSINWEAERLVRTEIARVQNMASQARMNQASKVVPKMKKQWIWSGKSRVQHAIAHGQVVPVDQAFIVGGEKLRFPLDPRGSAKNTINCGCSMTSFMEGWPDINELAPELKQQAENVIDIGERLEKERAERKQKKAA